jgi:hypothetical protein
LPLWLLVDLLILVRAMCIVGEQLFTGHDSSCLVC